MQYSSSVHVPVVLEMFENVDGRTTESLVYY